MEQHDCQGPPSRSNPQPHSNTEFEELVRLCGNGPEYDLELEDRRDRLNSLPDRDRWCTIHHKIGHLAFQCLVTAETYRFTLACIPTEVEWYNRESREDRLAEITVPPVDVVSMFNLLHNCNNSMIKAYPVFVRNRDHLLADMNFMFEIEDPELQEMWLIWMAQTNRTTNDIVYDLCGILTDSLRQISGLVGDHMGEKYGLRESLTSSQLNGILFNLDLYEQAPLLDISTYNQVEERVVQVVNRYQQQMKALDEEMTAYLANKQELVQRLGFEVEIEHAFHFLVQAQIQFKDPARGVGLQVVEWPQLQSLFGNLRVPNLPEPEEDARRYL